MLNVLTREEAAALVREKTSSLTPETEYAGIASAAGRILARDIISEENVPSFDRSTVDGYAVCSADTFGAGGAIPAQLDVVGEIKMGETAVMEIKRGQCVKISTGGMLPKGADAAVMVEHTDCEDGSCLVYKSAAPYENVTRTGDDISAGETALRSGTALTASHTGVLAALGIHSVPVYKRPVISVISTGDEIVTGAPAQGQVRDINTFLLCAVARELGCEAVPYGAVKDNREEIERAVKECLKTSDAVLISGGSSAGTKDMTVEILSSLGEVYFHGIAMKPGKPTIFGMAEGKPVFGLPGHPLAAYFVFRLIVSEYIRGVMKMPADRAEREALLALNVPSNHGREEFVCVQLNEKDEAVPIHTKSGVENTTPIWRRSPPDRQARSSPSPAPAAGR